MELAQVLVVEDTVEMRQEMLAAAGGDDREVIELKSAAEALAYLSGSSKTVDVVVVDLVLDSGDSEGFAILAAAAEKDPRIPVIVVTSFSTRPLSIEAISYCPFDFLERISNSIDFFQMLKWKITLAVRYRRALLNAPLARRTTST